MNRQNILLFCGQKIILFCFLLLFNSCTTNKNLKQNSPDDFVYDQNNLALVKLYPKKNENINEIYKSEVQSNAISPLDFYENYILKADLPAPLTIDPTDYKFKAPTIINIPSSEYPESCPLIGGFLVVVVTAIIDTNGYPEYVELYNIYRDDNINTEWDKALTKDNIKPWTATYITEYDKPFIKLSLYTVLKTVFKPAVWDGKKVRIEINLVHRYIFSEEYDKRKKVED
jgi:hypothetical protein